MRDTIIIVYMSLHFNTFKNYMYIKLCIINDLNNKMDNNKYQIQTLTEIRDSLLPKLISGKIEVK